MASTGLYGLQLISFILGHKDMLVQQLEVKKNIVQGSQMKAFMYRKSFTE